MKIKKVKREVTLYQCSDGEEFESKADAEDHEHFLKEVKKRDSTFRDSGAKCCILCEESTSNFRKRRGKFLMCVLNEDEREVRPDTVCDLFKSRSSHFLVE